MLTGNFVGEIKENFAKEGNDKHSQDRAKDTA